MTVERVWILSNLFYDFVEFEKGRGGGGGGGEEDDFSFSVPIFRKHFAQGVGPKVFPSAAPSFETVF